MRIKRVFALSVLTPLTLSVAACGSAISEENGDAFIAHVREFIPSADAYEDDMLLKMADKVCTLGDVDNGAAVLDNYRHLEADDARAFAISALEYACPDKG